MSASFLKLDVVSLLVEEDMVTLAFALVAETVTEVDDDGIFSLKDAASEDGLVIGVLDLKGNLIESVVTSDLRDVKTVTLL